MSADKEEFFDAQATGERIAEELAIPSKRVHAAIELLLAGDTLPFIARYRKEATGNLDERQLRVIEDRLHEARELADRKKTILRTIDEQGKLTDALRSQIVSCHERSVLEEIYLPYRPKRRTRATIAEEQGLGPLADLMLEPTHSASRTNLISPFLNADLGVPDTETALKGACDILAYRWSEDQQARGFVFEQLRRGQLVSKVRRGKKDDDSRFREWFDSQQRVKGIPSHRFLAMKRGESEGVLRLSLVSDADYAIRWLRRHLIPEPSPVFADVLRDTVDDCWKRLLQPAGESLVMSEMKVAADIEAVSVFGKNLRDLLLAAPAGAKVTMAIDPGFRTGCKVAVVDATGSFVDTATIYPTAPRNDIDGASSTVLGLIQKHTVELIAIGNGTASRETDAFVSELLKTHQLKVTKAIVSESGASIYSASELAGEEYPDLDVTVRGAISIAHRLQDPLAELVKLDPKSIGVGQYQHDVDQKLLSRELEREVLSCVNSVGVELNQASASLLSYVAGIGPKLASSIVSHRDENGPFRNRLELMQVPRLGQKVFKQAAGFLRVGSSDNPLDRTAVHPESYYIVERMAESASEPIDRLLGRADVAKLVKPSQFVDEKTGVATITDILIELARPGRDPRQQFRTAKFREGINELQDLEPGMKLEGVVTNVTKFGAFVDVGVHQDGLVHISQLADRFVDDPSKVVSVGQVVRTTVLEVDVARKRISLSMKSSP
ncbi:MAG: Tex family protein [Planctomycetaceae bacterium]